MGTLGIDYKEFEIFCDRGIVFSLCAMIFVLPASIALLDSFAALAISLYLFKKISRMLTDWPVRASSLSLLGKILFIWEGFAPPVNPLNRPLQFLVLAVFISVLFSQYPGLSLYAFFGKFLKTLFLYFSFIEAFRDEKRIRMFLGFFLAAAFITVLNGCIQHYTGVNLLKWNFISEGRVNSSFHTANGLGAYLLPVIGLAGHALYSAVVKKKRVLTGALAVLFLLLLACLCWTYSRSAWIGYLSILFVMVLLDRRKALFAGASLVVFIFIFQPSLSHVRHLYLISDNSGGGVKNESPSFGLKSLLEQGGSGRLAFWKKAVSIIRTSPVHGTGLNTYARIVMRDPDRKTWWYAHNCYFQLTAETGFLGICSFLWMLLVLSQHSLKYCRQIKEPWPLTFLQGAVSGLFGFLVQSFFDNTFYTVQLSILMWLIFGLIMALTRLNPEKERIVD